MKTIYTILFFIDTFFMIFLSAELFRIMDKGAGVALITLVMSGMAVSMGLLLFIMLQYLKRPVSGKDN